MALFLELGRHLSRVISSLALKNRRENRMTVLYFFLKYLCQNHEYAKAAYFGMTESFLSFHRALPTKVWPVRTRKHFVY
jgi:hypothetical protein